MNSKYFIFLVSILCLTFSYSQQKATTENGKKVLLFNDGTWKYVEENTDCNSSKSLVNDFLSFCKNRKPQDFYPRNISIIEQWSKFFSPEFINSNNIIWKYSSINTYYFESYKIEDCLNEGVVKVKIFGINKMWKNLLYFKIVNEASKLFIYPSIDSSGNSIVINPWYKVEVNIK